MQIVLAPPARGSARSSHIPALDGLRGLAILLVLLHHLTYYGGLRPWVFVDKVFYLFTMPGWCGVDLFFVLSGFLITGILYDAKGADSYFRNFYVRRCLRIFPLYYGVLAVIFVAGPLFFGANPAYQNLAADQAWYWSYLINVKVALDGWPEISAIGHFWSLAIEEQFYLVWPMVVYHFGRRGLIRICMACILLALALRCGLAFSGEHLAAYVLSPARMDSLALGGLVALMARQPNGLLPWRRPAWRVAIGTGAVLLGVLVWKRGLWTEDALVYTVGYSVLALFFGAVLTVAATAAQGSAVSALFTSRALRFLGRYSYGLYVFHQPIFVLLRKVFRATDVPTVFGSQLPGLALFAIVAGGASLIIAIASWHYFESPFLRLKDRFVAVARPGASPAV
jgi:peptidoglycan/LPS O-acetylase OafA/YrhL